MKKLILIASLFLSFTANANCIGEAQVIGKIKEIRQTLQSCRAFLTADSEIRISGVCPLDEGNLLSEGIEVGLISGHDCKMNAGDSLSGILVDNGNFIFLE